MVIMEFTVERSIKDQIIISPMPLATYHIDMLVCTVASLGTATENEHHVKDHNLSADDHLTEGAVNTITILQVCKLGNRSPTEDLG